MAEPVQEKAEAPKASPEPIIVDLGKQKKNKIRRLRKGKGTLFSKVLETHSQLEARGVTGETTGPVIVVVNEKKRKLRWPYASLWR